MPVVSVDVADRARPRAHHEAVRPCTVRVIADTPQQLAVGDAGCGEERVVATDEVVDGEDPREVVALRLCSGTLCVVARVQAPEDLPAEGLERCCGDHALRCAADAHQEVDAHVG